jgi:hypothetical protein
MQNIFLALVLLIGLLSCCDGQLWGSKPAEVPQEIDNVQHALDNIEAYCNLIGKTVKTCLPALKIAAGTAFLLHGPQLTNSLLLVQGLKLSGAALITDSLSQLKDKYAEGRIALQKEMPKIVEAQKAMTKFASDISRLKKDVEKAADKMKSTLTIASAEFKTGKVSKDSLEKTKAIAEKLFSQERKKIESEIAELRQTKSKIDAANSAVKSILRTLDPNLVIKIGQQTFSTLLGVITVAKNKLASSTALGVGFGSQLANKLKQLLPAHLAGGWFSATIDASSAGLGVYLSMAMSKAALILSAATVGGEIVATEALKLLDGLLAKLGLAPLSTNAAAVTAVQTLVTGLAVFRHVASGALFASPSGGDNKNKGGAPTRAKTSLLLAPLLEIEKLLGKALFNA